MKTQILEALQEELNAREKDVIGALKAQETRSLKVEMMTSIELMKLNEGVMPTISTAGFHAPVDGYIGLNDEAYLAGQFISTSEDPEPGDFRVSGIQYREYSARFKFPLELFKDIEEMFKPLANNQEFSVEYGKSWAENGTEVANFFFKGNRPYLEGLGEVYNSKIANILRENADKDKGDSPEGRQEIQGIVLSTRIQENDYGIRETMMVKLDNNSTVWGTVPRALGNLSNGDRIQFTATFKKADCGKHSFFSRPSKASLIEDL